MLQGWMVPPPKKKKKKKKKHENRQYGNKRRTLIIYIYIYMYIYIYICICFIYIHPNITTCSYIYTYIYMYIYRLVGVVGGWVVVVMCVYVCVPKTQTFLKIASNTMIVYITVYIHIEIYTDKATRWVVVSLGE